jgi:hypothetical protein
VGKARTGGGGIAKRALVLLTLCVLFAAGVGTAAASGNGNGNANGNGKPGSPPGQGECEHGNSGKPCRDDPQPEHGKDCEAHGNQGGVNEDHCGGVTAPEPPPLTTTVTTMTTTTTTTTTTTSAPSSPPPPTTTAQTSPPSEPKRDEHEEPDEERAPSTTPPKATTPKTNDAPKQAKQETAEPKQGVKAAATPGTEKSEAGCAPPRVLAVAPKTAEGRLPFTGLPLWVFVLGGLAALLAGGGVRRLARPGPQAAE